MLVTSETTAFLIFLLDGAIIGLIFDFFRILRKSFKTPDIITYIEDIAFGIISALILIFSITLFNSGELRLFIFVGILLGITLYMLTLSKYIIKISVGVLNVIIKIIATILKVLLYPIIVIYKKIVKKKLTKFLRPHWSQKKLKNNEGFVEEK